MILVVSYPGEEHTAEVVARLARAGREVVEIDLADFPDRAGLALNWPPTLLQAPSYRVQLPNQPNGVDLGRAGVGWWRRVRPFTISSSITDPSFRAFAESETSQAIGGLLDALPCRAWVNPRQADEAAHRKPLQWAVALQVGLTLPRTLVTTQPEAARAFIQDVGVGKTIFKAFLASIESWRETRTVERDDLDRLELVRHAPVIFQEYIEGVDLRITVVGDQVFAAEIDARASRYPYDMRMAIGDAPVRAVTLPSHVQTMILELQRRLGLVYGAIDMRRTDQGNYVFFEVNPAGQWLFVEQRAELPISQAVADLLARLDQDQEQEQEQEAHQAIRRESARRADRP